MMLTIDHVLHSMRRYARRRLRNMYAYVKPCAPHIVSHMYDEHVNGAHGRFPYTMFWCMRACHACVYCTHGCACACMGVKV